MFAPALADTPSGFDPDTFGRLAAIESEHFWFAPRSRLITSLIARYFPNARYGLEVGCGTGIVLSAIAAKKHWQELVGSELHPAGFSIARQRLGDAAHFVQMDARHIPARDAFDVIGAFDVIEHIPEDDAVIAAMRDAVRPGGGVIIAVPQHPFLWSEFDEAAHHQRRYRRGELEEKLNRAGMRVVFSGSYTVLLFPLMVASRVFNGLAAQLRSSPAQKKDNLCAEFHPPRMINFLIRGLLQGEVSATLAGVRFPLGGSRVVVAIKD